MKLISYTTKPDRASENRGKVEAVFAALHAARLPGVSYMVVETEEGSFFHMVEGSQAAIDAVQALPAFREFSAEAGERQAVPSVRREAKVVGSYGSLVQQ